MYCNFQSVKSPKTNVLNSLDGVQVVEINKVGHDGISVSEKKLHTVSKPFRLSSCSCAVKSQVNVTKHEFFCN